MKLLTPKTLFDAPQMKGQDDFLMKCASQIDELKEHVTYVNFSHFGLCETDQQVDDRDLYSCDFVVIDLTSLMKIWKIKSKHDDEKRHLHLVLMNPFSGTASNTMSAFGWRFFVVDWGYENIFKDTVQAVKNKDLARLPHSGMTSTLRDALYMINEVAYDRIYPNRDFSANAANGNWPKGQTDLYTTVFQDLAAPTLMPLFEWEGDEFAYDDTEVVTLMTSLLLAKVAAELVSSYDEWDLANGNVVNKLGQDILNLLPDFNWHNRPDFGRDHSLLLSDGDDCLALASSYQLNKDQMRGFLTIPRTLTPLAKRKLPKMLGNLENGYPLLDGLDMEKPALWHDDAALTKHFTNYISLMPFILQYDLIHSLSGLTLSRLKLWNHMNGAAQNLYISNRRLRDLIDVYNHTLMPGMTDSFAHEAKNQHLPLVLDDIDSSIPGNFDLQLTFKMNGDNGSYF